MSTIHHAIRQMCADLGQNPLLVQGAGGNVSWKDGETLWIKGSGTWLANALLENIFVPVQLQPLQAALAIGNVDITPQTVGEQSLRPSIETVLHALMPHPIVVHLHAIHALSHLVTKNCHASVIAICHLANINAAFVEYHKPGPRLAKAILEALQQNPTANAVFLKNHGIVVGGSTIEEVQKRIALIHNTFQPAQIPTKVASNSAMATSVPSSPIAGYTPLQDNEVQSLALEQSLLDHLKQHWVLFPDHAVFLGANAPIYSSWNALESMATEHLPELVFIENTGVYVRPEFNRSKVVQLRCYYDVIRRVAADAKLDPLSPSAIDELLNWDAEKRRQEMAQK